MSYFGILIICVLLIVIIYFKDGSPISLVNKMNGNNLLNIITDKTYQFINFMYDNKNKYPDFKQYIDRLKNNTKSTIFTENLAFRDESGKLLTSYTLDKGKQISLCIRDQKTGDALNQNVIFYVVIHELAHVACPEEGHTTLFKKIYRFLLTIAKQNNFYQFHDYESAPVNYCGHVIDENILKQSF